MHTTWNMPVLATWSKWRCPFRPPSDLRPYPRVETSRPGDSLILGFHHSFGGVPRPRESPVSDERAAAVGAGFLLCVGPNLVVGRLVIHRTHTLLRHTRDSGRTRPTNRTCRTDYPHSTRMEAKSQRKIRWSQPRADNVRSSLHCRCPGPSEHDSGVKLEERLLEFFNLLVFEYQLAFQDTH